MLHVAYPAFLTLKGGQESNGTAYTPDMERITEPELMDDPLQATAYTSADFAESHSLIADTFAEYLPEQELRSHILNLGCGRGDISEEDKCS